MRYAVQIIIALITLAGSLGVALITAGSTAKTQTNETLDDRGAKVEKILNDVQVAQNKLDGLNDRVEDLTRIVNSPQKMCSAGLYSGWRDSIIVPSSWDSAQCKRFSNSIGGAYFQLGCVAGAEFSWGESMITGSEVLMADKGRPQSNSCKW
jgi:hypothetical protein